MTISNNMIATIPDDPRPLFRALADKKRTLAQAEVEVKFLKGRAAQAFCTEVYNGLRSIQINAASGLRLDVEEKDGVVKVALRDRRWGGMKAFVYVVKETGQVYIKTPEGGTQTNKLGNLTDLDSFYDLNKRAQRHLCDTFFALRRK